MKKGKAIAKLKAPVKGSTFTVNGMKFKITASDLTGKGTVSLTGITNKNKTSVSIPATIKNTKITYKVTEIGSSALSGCKKLTRSCLKAKQVIKQR